MQGTLKQMVESSQLALQPGGSVMKKCINGHIVPIYWE